MLVAASYISCLLHLLIAPFPLVIDLILCYFAYCGPRSHSIHTHTHTPYSLAVCSRLCHVGLHKCTLWCLHNMKSPNTHFSEYVPVAQGIVAELARHTWGHSPFLLLRLSLSRNTHPQSSNDKVDSSWFGSMLRLSSTFWSQKQTHYIEAKVKISGLLYLSEFQVDAFHCGFGKNAMGDYDVPLKGSIQH